MSVTLKEHLVLSVQYIALHSVCSHIVHYFERNFSQVFGGGGAPSLAERTALAILQYSCTLFDMHVAYRCATCIWHTMELMVRSFFIRRSLAMVDWRFDVEVFILTFLVCGLIWQMFESIQAVLQGLHVRASFVMLIVVIFIATYPAITLRLQRDEYVRGKLF